MKTRPWITKSDLLKGTDLEADNAIMAASLILFMLSGQKYTGVMSVTEQYTCETTGAPVGCYWDPSADSYWNPLIGSYVFTQGPSRRSTRLVPGTYIQLSRRPVREIEQITVAGDIVDPSEYRLSGSTVMLTGSAGWGLCSSPIITYSYGIPVPKLGQLAARKLADEFVLAFNGDSNCSLPSNVTSVSRQGLSFEVFDPQDFLEKGRVGVYEVDLFLSAVNPNHARKPARVFSPDLRRGRRIV